MCDAHAAERDEQVTERASAPVLAGDPWPEYAEALARVNTKAAARKGRNRDAQRAAKNPLHMTTVASLGASDPNPGAPAEWWATCSCGWEGRHHAGPSWAAYADATNDRDQHHRENR